MSQHENGARKTGTGRSPVAGVLETAVSQRKQIAMGKLGPPTGEGIGSNVTDSYGKTARTRPLPRPTGPG